MNFQEWINELRRLQINRYGFSANKSDGFYGDDDSWKTYFESGYTPDAALQEDFSYAD